MVAGTSLTGFASLHQASQRHPADSPQPSSQLPVGLRSPRIGFHTLGSKTILPSCQTIGQYRHCLLATPFFPAWSDDFEHHARKFQALAQDSLHQLQLLCSVWIPAHRFSQEDEGDFSRTRRWPLWLTFWTFLWQSAQAGSSCRDAVRQARALRISRDQPPPADDTGPYCTARGKLPLDRLDSIHQDLLQDAQSLITEGDLWCGHRVSVLDGTCFTMADTPENQALYPQPRVQKPGCGFPIARLLAFFCLSTGLIRTWITGHWYQHELSLLPGLLESLRRGEVLLGDRGFGNFVVLAQCVRLGLHAVFRANTASRKIDLRRGKPLGKNERLVTWSKGACRPKYLSAPEWDRLPDTVTVRVLKVRAHVRGFRTRSVLLVTTLLDPIRYPAAELTKLYLRRWNMELSFRDIKSILQMDHLSCKTPETVEREMRMHLLVHNLVRRTALEAARRHGRRIERISFAGTLSAMHAYGEALLRASTLKRRRRLEEDMYRMIAEDEVPLRPGRREPRALKRRPKPYPLLTRHRKKYPEILHRNRYHL